MPAAWLAKRAVVKLGPTAEEVAVRVSIEEASTVPTLHAGLRTGLNPRGWQGVMQCCSTAGRRGRLAAGGWRNWLCDGRFGGLDGQVVGPPREERRAKEAGQDRIGEAVHGKSFWDSVKRNENGIITLHTLCRRRPNGRVLSNRVPMNAFNIYWNASLHATTTCQYGSALPLLFSHSRLTVVEYPLSRPR